MSTTEWTVYAGTQETLPPEGRLVVLKRSIRGMHLCVVEKYQDLGRECFRWTSLKRGIANPTCNGHTYAVCSPVVQGDAWIAVPEAPKDLFGRMLDAHEAAVIHKTSTNEGQK